MTTEQTVTIEQIAGTFNAAHAEFREMSGWLWDPLAAELVASAAPRAGERVLDACCGAGSSALPAARAVGPDGLVDGVDVADALLAHGRADATGLDQLSYHHADVMTWDGGPYDLVQSGFGVFFLPDMDAGCARLVSLLRPGGRFAVLVWAAGGLAETMGALFEAAAEILPEPPIPPASRAAGERLDEEPKLAGWLRSLGLVEVTTRPVRRRPPLTDELAWLFARGSGLRRVLDQAGPAGEQRLREGYLGRLRDRGITELNASALIGIGTRPPG